MTLRRRLAAVLFGLLLAVGVGEGATRLWGGEARLFIDLVGRRTGIVVGRDVADDVAAGLDGVHVDIGEVSQQVRRLFELDPVELYH